MRVLLLLLLMYLPNQVAAHEKLFSVGYVFDDGLMLGYHSIHKEKKSIGWYVNGIYAGDQDHHIKSGTLESTITQFIEQTTTTYSRAVKCNKKGKCHPFGPPIPETTTTLTPVELFISEDYFIKTKHKEQTIIINVGLNYSLRHNVFIYGGIGVAKEKITDSFDNTETKFTDKIDKYKFNANVGFILTQDKYGLDVGYNTNSDIFYVGLSYEF
jgi:hypothetical protein